MDDLWSRTLEALKASLPPDHFEDLERSVTCTSVNGSQVTLQVPGRIQRDWIVEHHVELLRRELAVQAGAPVAIEIEVVSRRKRARRARTRQESPGRRTEDRQSLELPLQQPVGAPVVVQPAPGPAAVLAPAGPPPAKPVSVAPAAAGNAEEPAPARGEIPSFNPRYTFASFVPGPSNQMAHAACLGVARAPGRTYNPLFLYGGSGLGKTHLIQAVGHHALSHDPTCRVVFRSAEDFMNDFTRSLRTQRMEQFRRFYREECDLLLLDDVQFMSRKEQTQQEFFHTFEALLRRGAQMLMTCDRPPREIDDLDERLRTRFTWGLLADIQPPGLETRMAIVQKKAEFDHIALDDDVALFLARHFTSNIRELEGALTRLGAYASFSQQAITLDYARTLLAEQLPITRQLSIEDTIKLVAEHFRIRPADIKGSRRHRSVARPRQVAMYLARNVLERSYPEIARAFGRDHTTVISGCRRVEGLMAEDASFSREVEDLRRQVRG